ncbi:MAG: hypothetical protein EOO03_18325 [Chitinophagaceae bacterium]|nr:MAG: hypothetical protein EOO03_18325 [Chitinophagaceae bacterium]
MLINKAGENPVADFRLYKYREEVQIITVQSVEEEALLIGAAYAGIEIFSPAAYQNWGLGCMQCGVPLIGVENDVSLAQYRDAAVYAELTEQAIANQMMLLYKDEALHSELAAQGQALTANYTWQHSSQLLWQSILQCGKD